MCDEVWCPSIVFDISADGLTHQMRHRMAKSIQKVLVHCSCRYRAIADDDQHPSWSADKKSDAMRLLGEFKMIYQKRAGDRDLGLVDNRSKMVYGEEQARLSFW